MPADRFKELDRLVEQAMAEITALRREKVSLEKRAETLSRDLRARSEAAKAAEGWAEERAALTRRVEQLVRQLERLEPS